MKVEYEYENQIKPKDLSRYRSQIRRMWEVSGSNKENNRAGAGIRRPSRGGGHLWTL